MVEGKQTLPEESSFDEKPLQLNDTGNISRILHQYIFWNCFVVMNTSTYLWMNQTCITNSVPPIDMKLLSRQTKKDTDRTNS